MLKLGNGLAGTNFCMYKSGDSNYILGFCWGN
jgi:hypothetical protein